VLREPALLVGPEMLCWVGVMQWVGLSIARVDHALEALGRLTAA